METDTTEIEAGETEPVAEVAAEETSAAAPAPALPAKPKEPQVPLPSSLQEIVGSLLFASESPLTVADLRECVRGVAPEEGESAEVMEVYRTCTSREIEQALHGLGKELERAGCGFRLVCAGGAYRMQTAPSCGRYVRALLHLDRPNRLSRAALETLAIIAYRQPITKAEIEQIRGVAVDSIVKTLVDLQLVRLVGRSELPGHPFLYGTSQTFLEHFGLASLSELNAIDPTLQRSDPRERARLFRKKEKPAKDDAQPTLEDAANEAAKAAEPESTEPPETEDRPEAEEPQELETPQEPDEESAPSAAPAAADDDDVFIDDTPDEFDDDDDDDDEEFDDDEEDGGNDDEEVEDGEEI